MATKYARSVGGNWTSNSTWSTTSGGSADTTAPTSADDVYMDANSGAVTINAAASCRSLDCSNYTNTLTHNAFTLTIGDATAGAGNIAIKLVTGMTYTLISVTTSALAFNSSSTTQQTLDFADKSIGNINFTGTGSNYAISSAIIQSSTASVTVTRGIIHFDGSTDNLGLTHTFGFFTSSVSNTRSIYLGTATYDVYGNGSGSVGWTLSPTSLTFDAGTSIINMRQSFTNFSGGNALTYNEVYLINQSSSNVFGTSSFNVFSYTGTTTKTNSLNLGVNITVTGTLIIAGNSNVNRVLVTSTAIGTQRTITLTGATVTASYCDFRDVRMTPDQDLSAITGFSGDAGGNSGITFTASQAQYWYRNTGNWSDSSKWFTATNGVGAGRVPLPQDDVYIDANSRNTGSQTITQDMPRAGRSIDFTGVGAITWNISSVAFSIFGSLKLTTSITLNSNKAISFRGRGSYNITSATRVFGAQGGLNISVDAPGGTYTLLDTFSAGGWSDRTFSLNAGTLDTNGFILSTGGFNSAGTLTRVLNLGSSTISLYDGGATGSYSVWNVTATGLTINAGTSTLNINSTAPATKTFTGAGFTYYNLLIASSGNCVNIISGSNTFNSINVSTTNTVNFTAGTTQTVSDFQAFGSGIAFKTLQSTTPGSTWTLSKSSGNVTCDYINLQDSTATGGATFYAGSHSNNISNNSGWSFSDLTYSASVLTVTTSVLDPTITTGCNVVVDSVSVLISTIGPTITIDQPQREVIQTGGGPGKRKRRKLRKRVTLSIEVTGKRLVRRDKSLITIGTIELKRNIKASLSGLKYKFIYYNSWVQAYKLRVGNVTYSFSGLKFRPYSETNELWGAKFSDLSKQVFVEGQGDISSLFRETKLYKAEIDIEGQKIKSFNNFTLVQGKKDITPILVALDLNQIEGE